MTLKTLLLVAAGALLTSCASPPLQETAFSTFVDHSPEDTAWILDKESADVQARLLVETRGISPSDFDAIVKSFSDSWLLVGPRIHFVECHNIPGRDAIGPPWEPAQISRDRVNEYGRLAALSLSIGSGPEDVAFLLRVVAAEHGTSVGTQSEVQPGTGYLISTALTALPLPTTLNAETVSYYQSYEVGTSLTEAIGTHVRGAWNALRAAPGSGSANRVWPATIQVH